MADIKARLSATLHKAVEFVQSEIAQINEHAVGTRWELVNCSPRMVGSMTVQYKYQEKTSEYGSWVLNGLPKSAATDRGTTVRPVIWGVWSAQSPFLNLAVRSIISALKPRFCADHMLLDFRVVRNEAHKPYVTLLNVPAGMSTHNFITVRLQNDSKETVIRICHVYAQS